MGQTLKLRDAQMKEFKANQPSLDLHHRDLGTQTDPAEAKSEAGVQTSSDPLFGHEAASVKPESVSASHQSMDTFKSLAQLRSNLRDLEV